MPDAQASAVLFTCPACDRDVEAIFRYAVDLGVPDGLGAKTINAKARLSGLVVVHNCVPLEGGGDGDGNDRGVPLREPASAG